MTANTLENISYFYKIVLSVQLWPPQTIEQRTTAPSAAELCR